MTTDAKPDLDALKAALIRLKEGLECEDTLGELHQGVRAYINVPAEAEDKGAKWDDLAEALDDLRGVVQNLWECLDTVEAGLDRLPKMGE